MDVETGAAAGVTVQTMAGGKHRGSVAGVASLDRNPTVESTDETSGCRREHLARDRIAARLGELLEPLA